MRHDVLPEQVRLMREMPVLSRCFCAMGRSKRRPGPRSSAKGSRDALVPPGQDQASEKLHRKGRPKWEQPSSLWLRNRLREDVLHGWHLQAPSLRIYVVAIGSLFYEVRTTRVFVVRWL